MLFMSKKKPTSEPGRKKLQTQLRLHPILREQLEKLVEVNATNLTTEITIAIRERLERHGLWPVPRDDA